jgi:hypothetical protein
MIQFWGLGVNTPSSRTLVDGVYIPNGSLCISKNDGCQLMYDEKIVYDQEQFDMKYMVIANMTY